MGREINRAQTCYMKLNSCSDKLSSRCRTVVGGKFLVMHVLEGYNWMVCLGVLKMECT